VKSVNNPKELELLVGELLKEAKKITPEPNNQRESNIVILRKFLVAVALVRKRFHFFAKHKRLSRKRNCK
jgi:hypothetical protein